MKLKKNKDKSKKKQLKYSPKGIYSELALVQWPKFSTLMKDSGLVILFVLIFAAFFIACESLVGVSWKVFL